MASSPESEVGHAFAMQYYRALKADADQLRLFYAEGASITRSRLAADGTFESYAAGHDFRRILADHHADALDLSRCASVETQRINHDTLLVQITGTLEYVDGTGRDFTHSVVLASRDNAYLVTNDIFVLTAATSLTPSSLEQAQATVPGPAAAVPNSVTRHSAQPSASPLPTTTAPRLSTPERKEVEPAAPVRSTDNGPAPAPRAEVSEPQQLPEEAPAVVEEVENQRPDDVAGETAPLEPESEEPSSKADTKAVESVEKNDFVDHSKPAAPEKPVERRSNNPWRKVDPPAAPASFEAPPTKPGTAAAAPAPAPKEEVKFAEGSYASKLWAASRSNPSSSGPRGYAIPAPAPPVQAQQPRDQDREKFERPERTNRGNPAATVWIGNVSSNVPDEQVRKAILGHLKSSEAKIVRLERLPRHCYVEFESAATAKNFVSSSEGLKIDDKPVPVDVTRSRNNLGGGGFRGRPNGAARGGARRVAAN